MQSAFRLAATSFPHQIMPRRQINIPSSPFPSHGLLPKDETQAASFLKRFPDYDGRGIRVAVLDTGVDPAAFGLNGTGKVVDILDCTGSGDIPLKLVEPVISEGSSKRSDAIRLPGVSGRALLVSPDWVNPTSQWKVGYKRAFDLWPKDLVKRRKEERKAEWDVKVAKLVSQAKKELNDFENAPKETPEEKKQDSKDGEQPSNPEKIDTEKENDKIEKKARKADLEAKLSYLIDFSLDDPGPVLDIVVWHDGKDWRVVVGGAEGDGEQNISPQSDESAVLDLRYMKPMTDFHKEKHFETFGTQDLMSYSVNVLDDGEIVSLSVVSGTHGTHVAAIIGGQIDDNPDLNGVAPGVEIVSLKIGDTRLGSLETGQALMRATKAIIDTKCDICNMSYGEDAAWGTEDRGQFIAMLRDEVIKKRNLLFVAAAGNAGPALSTIGAPSTSSGIISVGAYETPSMQKAEYALLENVPAGAYTWSSRGPTYDGANVLVYAPGAAITGVPTYNLQRSQLMNGTSMASPNACGAIALVLSALKAENISYSPARIIKALQATNKDVDDPQNVGLIQVEALYQFLAANKEHSDNDADFEIRIHRQGRTPPDFSKPFSDREGARGIYLRELEETSKLFEAACFIKPSFSTTKETKNMYSLDLKLALATTEAWVRAPDYLSLASAGRNFNVRVDPTQLSPGLHYAEIRGYDTATPGRMIFTIPITVCKPETVKSPSHHFKDWHSSPGQIERKFLVVPEAATWVELRFTTRNHASPVNLWTHCVQLQPEVRLSKSQQQFILNCTAGETVSKSFSVSGGVTMEICSSQFWNSLPTADVSMEIHFHGITLDTGKELTVLGGGSLPRIQVTSKVRLEVFSPSISFDRCRSFIRPSDSKISPLGERDIMPDDKRLMQLVTTYSFKLSEKTKVTLSWPTTDNLYDSAFSVLSKLIDSHGQIVHFGSVYSSEKELNKGEYSVMLQLEHWEYKVLEAVKGLAIALDTQLSDKTKKLSLGCYRDHIDALCKPDATAFKDVKMPLGETRSLVVSTDLKGDTSELYKTAKAGDVLLGKLNLGPANSKSTFDLNFVLPPQTKNTKDEDEVKEKQLTIDLQLGIVDNIQDEKEKKSFLENLAINHKHWPIQAAQLKALSKDADPEEIAKAADAVLSLIDEAELSNFLGRKSSPETEQTTEDKKMNKEMEKKRAAWLNASMRRIEASYRAKESIDKQNNLFNRYRQFVESPDKDQDFLLINAKRDFAQERYGSALKTLVKLLEDSLPKEKYSEVVDLKSDCLVKLGWKALIEYETRWKLVREPPMEGVW